MLHSFKAIQHHNLLTQGGKVFERLLHNLELFLGDQDSVRR